MELTDGIETRRSVRGYEVTPVPRGVIENILDMSRNCPSNSNSQPWEVAVVSGNTKRELSEILRTLAASKTAPHPDYTESRQWTPEMEQRAKQHYVNRYRVPGLENISEQQKFDLRLQNFDFYGAPCALLLFMDDRLGLWSIYDMGLLSQTICLAAHALGLGTCLQASTTYYPDAVRDFLKIPKTKKLLIGIALGYPDYDKPLNTYRSRKKELTEFVSWYD
jgi:nitroreductase